MNRVVNTTATVIWHCTYRLLPYFLLSYQKLVKVLKLFLKNEIQMVKEVRTSSYHPFSLLISFHSHSHHLSFPLFSPPILPIFPPPFFSHHLSSTSTFHYILELSLLSFFFILFSLSLFTSSFHYLFSLPQMWGHS